MSLDKRKAKVLKLFRGFLQSDKTSEDLDKMIQEVEDIFDMQDSIIEGLERGMNE